MTIRKHISFSEYRLYVGCAFKHALQYRLDHEEQTNEFLVFGSALHSAIEEIVVKKPNKILYEKVFNKHLEVESNAITVKSYFGRQFSAQGTNILKELNFFERFKDWEVVGVEDQIIEPLFEDADGQFSFKGVIDLVLKKGDEYLILDWKSASRPWDVEKKKEDKGFWGQLALYKHFYSQKHNIPLDKITTRFVALARDPINVQQYEVKVSDEFREFIVADLTRAAKEIKLQKPFEDLEKAKFSAMGTAACQYCQFNKVICNAEAKQSVEVKVEIE